MFIFFLDYSDDSYYRDKLIELEIRNELLLETVSDLKTNLASLERKFEAFCSRHVDCKRKPYILYL
jgi:hypothetical protein